MTAKEGYDRFIQEAITRALAGDKFAELALVAIALAQQGGFPPEPPKGGEPAVVVDFNEYRLRFAA